jgi:hypothetical protein
MEKVFMIPRSLKRQFPKLKKVFDAKKPIHVEVTARDNNGGTVGDAQNCAMARAVCREFKADVAVIGLSYSYVIKGDTAIRYKTPVTVGREITSFDRNKQFAPGKYGLSPISKSQRLDAHKRSGGVKKSTTGHAPKRVVVHTKTSGVRVMPRG